MPTATIERPAETLPPFFDFDAAYNVSQTHEAISKCETRYSSFLGLTEPDDKPRHLPTTAEYRLLKTADPDPEGNAEARAWGSKMDAALERTPDEVKRARVAKMAGAMIATGSVTIFGVLFSEFSSRMSAAYDALAALLS